MSCGHLLGRFGACLLCAPAKIGCGPSTCTHVLGRMLGPDCPMCAAGGAMSTPDADPPVSVDIAAVQNAPDAAEVIVDVIDDGIDGADALETLRQLDADAARESLAEFVKLAFSVAHPGIELEWGPHLQAICDHVQWQLEDREAVHRDPSKKRKLKAQNLLINVPPRSLKTVILTFATVWAWLRWPSLRIMYLSANPRVASSSARMARDLIRSHWFRSTFAPNWNHDYRDGETGDPISQEEWERRNPVEPEAWEIRSDQDALSDLGNTAGGARISRGLSSMITGEGCQWLIIDDPHDVRDGNDKVAKAVGDYDGAVHNRLNDHRTSIRTCIMQRVRPNDLSAKWLELKSLVHLRLPMEYEDAANGRVECKCGTCVGVNVYGFADWRTTEGDVLHPRFTPDFLEGEKKRLGSRYSGQHQQRPIAAGGQIFKVAWWNWFSFTEPGPAARPEGARLSPAHVIGRRRDGSLDLEHVDISVDPTGGSLEKEASNLGIGVCGVSGERRFLLRDLTLGPATWLQSMDQLRNAVRVAARIAGKQKIFTILIEKKALGQAAIEQLTKHILDGDLRYPDGQPIRAVVEPYEPTGKGSKEDRIELMEPDVHAGVLHLEDGADANTAPVRDEAEGYPKAPKRDRLDYLAQWLDFRRASEADWVRLFKRKRAEATAAAASKASPAAA